jgi:hypothetical protein
MRETIEQKEYTILSDETSEILRNSCLLKQHQTTGPLNVSRKSPYTFARTWFLES